MIALTTLQELAENVLKRAFEAWDRKEEFQYAFLFGPQGVLEVPLHVESIGSRDDLTRARTHIAEIAEEYAVTGLIVVCPSIMFDMHTGTRTTGIFVSLLNRGFFPYEMTRTFIRSKQQQWTEVERVPFASDPITCDLWCASA